MLKHKLKIYISIICILCFCISVNTFKADAEGSLSYISEETLNDGYSAFYVYLSSELKLLPEDIKSLSTEQIEQYANDFQNYNYSEDGTSYYDSANAIKPEDVPSNFKDADITTQVVSVANKNEGVGYRESQQMKTVAENYGVDMNGINGDDIIISKEFDANKAANDENYAGTIIYEDSVIKMLDNLSKDILGDRDAQNVLDLVPPLEGQNAYNEIRRDNPGMNQEELFRLWAEVMFDKANKAEFINNSTIPVKTETPNEIGNIENFWGNLQETDAMNVINKIDYESWYLAIIQSEELIKKFEDAFDFDPTKATKEEVTGALKDALNMNSNTDFYNGDKGYIAITYQAKNQPEYHYYLSTIVYNINKYDYNETSKNLRFTDKEVKQLVFDEKAFTKYLDILPSRSEGYKQAAKIYTSWLDAIEAFNQQNPNMTIKRAYPDVESTKKLSGDKTQVVFKMDFEKYIVDKTGGDYLGANVVAQDFFRNFYSDIASTGGKFQGASSYRGYPDGYVRLQYKHSDKGYNRQNVDLSLMTVPFILKNTSNNEIKFNYEAHIVAIFKYIVDKSVISDHTTALDNRIEYFPYRQYIEEEKCPMIDEKITYDDIKENVKTRKDILNMFNKRALNLIESDVIERKIYEGKFGEHSGNIALTLGYMCDTSGHSNIMLYNPSICEGKDNSSEALITKKDLHIHTISLNCETRQYWDTLTNYSEGAKAVKNSTATTILQTYTCKCMASTEVDCYNHDAHKHNENCKQKCLNCGEEKMCLETCAGSNYDYTHKEYKCNTCDSFYKSNSMTGFYMKDMNKWYTHSEKCFEITSDNEWCTTEYAYIIDSSSPEYRNKNKSSIEPKSRLGEIGTWDSLEWYYKGKPYSFPPKTPDVTPGPEYIEFVPIIDGGGIKIESFISM